MQIMHLGALILAAALAHVRMHMDARTWVQTHTCPPRMLGT